MVMKVKMVRKRPLKKISKMEKKLKKRRKKLMTVGNNQKLKVMLRLKRTQNRTVTPKQTEMRMVRKALMEKKLKKRQPAKMNLRKLTVLKKAKKQLEMVKENEERVALSLVGHIQCRTTN